MTTPLLRNSFVFLIIALAAALNAFPTVAAEAETATAQSPPAGQVCPAGSFVTGFDNQGNIICGEIGGRDAATPEVPANATVAGAAAGAAAAGSAIPVDSAAQSPPVQAATPATSALAIEKIKPWSVPYGTREVTIAISGTGFTADSVVVFQGERYVPSVDQAGTRLDVTIATRHLAMGAYPLTVSNGPETKATLRKALVVY